MLELKLFAQLCFKTLLNFVCAMLHHILELCLSHIDSDPGSWYLIGTVLRYTYIILIDLGTHIKAPMSRCHTCELTRYMLYFVTTLLCNRCHIKLIHVTYIPA